MNLSKETMQQKLHTIKTKFTLKKTIAAAIAGAFIATGIAYLPHAAFAASPQATHFNQYRHNFNAESTLQNIQDRFGVDKKVLLEYQAKGWKAQELHRAAFIAHTAKVPIADVLNAKAQNKTWTEISESYGVTKEQYINATRDFRNNQLAKNLNLKEDVVKTLISKGYHPRDIAMAATLSQKANKSIDTVLEHKKINNTWQDVATTIGLSNEVYEACRTDAEQCFGNDRHTRYGDKQNFRHHRQYQN